MGDDESEVDAGWEAAEEHGHDLEEWILSQDNYSHPEYAGRDVDGRFNRKLGSRSPGDDDED